RIEGRLASGRAVRCRARAVVLTVPAGVLAAPKGAAGAIAFDPEPAHARRALAGFVTGSVIRVNAWFREFPWKDDRGGERMSFLHLAGSHFQVLWTAYPDRSPLAVVW